jgi:rusticyanin
MRWLLISGLLAIAVGTLGLAGTAAALTLGGHLVLKDHLGGGAMSGGMMGDDPGRMMGSMMAGAASKYVSEREARTLGDQPPQEASVDRAAKRIIFHSDTVHVTVLGSPEGGPEMAFRIAGLSNPILVVAPGARVDLEFINGDPDTSHAWELARGQGSFGYMPMMGGQAAFPGSVGMPVGIPSSRGWPAETLTFTAVEPGRYTYFCPMPGHAQKGMHGQFLVVT